MDPKDVTFLIETVESHSAIWDVSDKYYLDKGHQHLQWQKVCKIMGRPMSDMEILKKKYMALRKHYASELKREREGRYTSSSREPVAYKSIWPYFEQMQFLAKVIRPRNPKSVFTQRVSTTTSSIPSPSLPTSPLRQECDDVREVDGDVAVPRDTLPSPNSEHSSEPKELFFDSRGTAPLASTVSRKRKRGHVNSGKAFETLIKQNQDIITLIAENQKLTPDEEEIIGFTQMIKAPLKRIPTHIRGGFMLKIIEQIQKEASKY